MAWSARMGKSAAFILDTKGFDKMVNALSAERRKPVLRQAMILGADVPRTNIRNIYKSMKPTSDLYKGVVMHIFPSAEGATVRRIYVPGGMGDKFDKKGPVYRSYILNFLEKGAQSRQTKGKGTRYSGLQLNRGSIPALKFFRKGLGRSRAKAFKTIERYLLVELANQARKG